MATIERALSPAERARPEPIVLRAHQVGDIGWIAHRQGLLYAQEYGWDETFEALVAEIGAKFVREFDPQHERCWVAEQGGRIVGSVFVVRKSARVAQLRLLYVEPAARGQGLGGRLVDECIGFARARGYRTLMLWTNDVLHAARAVYEARGFRLRKHERHRAFGKVLVGQFWELAL
jgi:GNAT superfamily N-acetyltransferase